MSAGVAEGIFRRDLDPAGGAAFFVAGMIGAGLLEHSRREFDDIFAVVEAWLLAPGAKPVLGKKAAKA